MTGEDRREFLRQKVQELNAISRCLRGDELGYFRDLLVHAAKSTIDYEINIHIFQPPKREG